MQIIDDTQDALELWDDDDTQWILTDGTQYAVCAEREALARLGNHPLGDDQPGKVDTPDQELNDDRPAPPAKEGWPA